MSSQRGNVKKGAPKYQNTFAFKHNPKSKKTERILALPIYGLCEKCRKQIEWRKKYRKYKPLTQPASCIHCHQKTVTSAYHAACDPCARERDICAKCCQSKEIVLSEQELALQREKEAKEFEGTLEGMRERDRRAHLRKVEKEKEEERRARREAAGGAEDGDADGDARYESYDEDMDE
ncbi:hypothetical protein PybrP1_011464 [[Pythium] brassicae (nom. inval.)]|nr:hypothetical protein PybrP1_011464 [[Pythium] brassicae (nom. inval.)]